MVTQEERDLRDQLVSWEDRNAMLKDWVSMDSAWRHAGQPKIIWSAGFELPKIGSKVAVDNGTKVGTVCSFGLKLVDGVFEQSAWVKLGSQFEKFAGFEMKILSDEELEEITKRSTSFSKRLKSAGKIVERQRKERRQKQVNGSHLLDQMIALAEGLTVSELSSYFKITGPVKGRAVYLALKGGRVDINGFEMQHPGLISITKEEAKRRHLGQVRGTINFDVDDGTAIAAFKEALSHLKE